jgi:type II secretory pathway pseudopilin PulG
MTLIEILLAIAVLVIGIVGLLPIFIAGLSKGGKSVTKSASTIIVNSVAESIRQSMRNDEFTTSERSSGTNLVEYWHDGVKTGLFFRLPPTGDARPVGPEAYEVPFDAVDSGGALLAPRERVFRMGGGDGGPLDLPVTDTEKDQLATYSFNFKVRITSEPHIDNVYEFVVRVYRNYDAALDVAGATGAWNQENLVQEIHFMVTGN